MKFNCGETRAQKVERLLRWHIWFAWYPVRVGPNDCRWLEKVHRLGTIAWDSWIFDYKAIDGTSNS